MSLGVSAIDAIKEAREGNWVGVGMSIAGAIPGIGAAVKGVKAFKAMKGARQMRASAEAIKGKIPANIFRKAFNDP